MAIHPIEHAVVSKFGPFGELDIEFSPQLNIVIGENGAGKSQLLKLLYTTTAVLSTSKEDHNTKEYLGRETARKLVGVFRPWRLGRLTQRGQGRTSAEVTVDYFDAGTLSFSFSSISSTKVQINEAPQTNLTETAAFIPTRELLSIYRGLASLYDERVVDFDETWRDTALLLGRPVRRGTKESKVQRVLDPIAEALGGGRIIENGQGEFVLTKSGLGNLEMHLVAEGFRKLGMIAHLVASGALLEGGYLFWDEPEANLNPKTLAQVAKTIVELAASGVQVFLATHSVYLLREIEMLTPSTKGDLDTNYIGLHNVEDSVFAEYGPSVPDAGDISALDAELHQAERYMEQEW